MPMSNFSHFLDGVAIRGVPITQLHPGKVFWVNNSTVLPDNGIGGSNGNNGSYLKPFSTIDYAIGRCKASRGDIIAVMPGHAETVSATSIAMDVAGVAVVGVGPGDLRPALSFNATDSNIPMSAANCALINLTLKATIDSVVAGVTISAVSCSIDVETVDSTVAIEFISAIVSTASGDNLNIKVRHKGFAAGDAMVRYIDVVGCRDAVINVDFFGKASTAVVNMRTTACDNIRVMGKFYNESAALTKNVVNSTTSTWSVEGFDAKASEYFAGSDDVAVHIINQSVSNPAIYVPGLGYMVSKVEDVNVAATDALFDVTGKVLITLWTAEVTNALSAAVTDYKIEMTTNNKVLLAAGNIASSVIGHMIQLNGDSAATALTTSTGAVTVKGEADNAGKGLAMRIVGLAGGTDVLKSTRTAGDAGDEIKHILFYLPLEVGALVAASA